MARILALIDHSVYAGSVGACAAWLSTTTGAEVELVHVVDQRRATSRHYARAGGMAVGFGPGMILEAAVAAYEGLGQALARGNDLLEETKAHMLSLGATVVRPRLVRGRLEHIVNQDNSDLIVLGKRGEGADFARLPLGSSVASLATSIAKPMMLAARSFRPPSNWLLAFHSDPALRAGIERIATGTLRLPSLPCQLVHAGPAADAVEAEMNEAGSLLSAAGFETSLHLAEGPPARLLPQRVITSKIDMIALGGLKRSPFRRAMVGSGTAEALLRACQVPGLLLR